jgi:hypothetical protein
MLLSEVPSGAVFRVEDAAGKFTLQPFEAGQPLLIQNLVSISPGASGSITTTSKLSVLLPEDKIGVAAGRWPVEQVWRSQHRRSRGCIGLACGSSATEGKGGQVTLMTLQNVPVIKTLQEASGKKTSRVQLPG